MLAILIYISEEDYKKVLASTDSLLESFRYNSVKECAYQELDSEGLCSTDFKDYANMLDDMYQITGNHYYIIISDI